MKEMASVQKNHHRLSPNISLILVSLIRLHAFLKCYSMKSNHRHNTYIKLKEGKTIFYIKHLKSGKIKVGSFIYFPPLHLGWLCWKARHMSSIVSGKVEQHLDILNTSCCAKMLDNIWVVYQVGCSSQAVLAQKTPKGISCH